MLELKNLSTLLVLLLYIVIRDITIPLLRRRQNNRHAGHTAGNPESSGSLEAVTAKYDAQWAEQWRVNERVDKNVARIFERLDKEHK